MMRPSGRRKGVDPGGAGGVERGSLMDDVEQRAEEVAGEILRSFAGVTRDDGVTLHEALVIDDYGSDAERAAARELDTDRRWQDVPGHLIEGHSDALHFVDPKGFRYYLPAYMVWALRHFRTSDSFSVDHVIFSLTLGKGSDANTGLCDMRGWALERFRLLTGDQSRAVCRFLRFMAGQERCADAGVAKAALNAFWGEYCAPAGESTDDTPRP